MTVKEITEFRKSGKLQEAYEVAEIEFATAQNKFTAGALFWCLNDFCKNETDQDKLNSLYERMLSLRDTYCQDDEYINRSIISLEAKVDPLGQELKLARDNAKAGVVDEPTFNKFQRIFKTGELKVSLYPDFGWLIYYNLKSADIRDANKRKQLLHLFFKLNLPRPDLLHSLILSEAINVEKNTPLQFRIRDFMDLWGWENFIEDDWKQYPTEKGFKPSRVEKLIAVYAKELITDGVASPEKFTNLVDQALEKFANNQYMPLYKAYVLKSLGRNDEAVDYYRDLIIKTPSKAFLWDHASDLIDDQDLKIALLCKAISSERNEEFIGGTRLKLAKALIDKQLFSEAKTELDNYKNFYLSKGWNLKWDFQELERKIPSGITSVNSAYLYQSGVSKADVFIYNSLPTEMAIKISERQVEDRRRPGKKILQWTLKSSSGQYRLNNPHRFGLDNRTKNGAIFDIKLKDGKIIWINKSTADPLAQDWIKKSEGIIKLRTDRNSNPYALIDGVYVGGRLLDSISNNDLVRIIAVKQEDGRWTAIALAKI